MPRTPSPAHFFLWHREAGVTDIVGPKPVDWTSLSPPPPERGSAPFRHTAPVPEASPEASVRSAVESATEAASLNALERALNAYEGCRLKATATHTVFGAGDANADIMFVGEAPGAAEDRAGIPFVGPSGHLLDRMLNSIGFHREDIYITNIIPWRPPGNRKPTHQEIAACLPFLHRHIELITPRLLVPLGGSAATTLLGRTEGISRLRGRSFSFETPNLARPVEVLPTFHPAYLLRSPAQKRLAWRDLLAIRAFLS